MANTVKERIQPELDKAKQESKQRAARISDILKSAASMTFEEVKGGSAELNTLTRRSVAELLEELDEMPDEVLDDLPVDTTTTQLSTEVEAAATEPSAPTWKELLTNLFEIVRDRRGDWLQQFKAYLGKNAEKFDGDMTEEYGDRYRKVKSVLQHLVTQLRNAQRQASPANTETEARPVSIEVVDDDTAETHSPSAQ